MRSEEVKVTYVGGPTALLEFAGLRFLTDPTFDAAGTEYKLTTYTLRKTQAPAIEPELIPDIDAVLLSHDHHFDNLDHSGRRFLTRVPRILTTSAGALRLGGNCIGLANWHSVDIPTRDGRVLRVTGTPARHGPAAGDRGPVTGFVLALTDFPKNTIYVSGDTVWYEDIAEVGRRFKPTLAVLFMGAARIPEIGPPNLTMTAQEAIEFAQAFAESTIVPLHFEDWAHLSESSDDIQRAFTIAGIEDRLRWPKRGVSTNLTRLLGAA